MDTQQQNRPHLETIQEESEKEDETAGSETGEGEEEDFPFQVDEETNEMLAEDESEEEEEEEEEEDDEDEDEDDEEDAPLRVLRPRRVSRSISKENFTRMQSSNNHLEEMEDSSASGEDTRVDDLSGEASPSGQFKSGNEKRFSVRELRMKVPKVRWQRRPEPKPAVQKRKKKHKMKKLGDEPFQQWLVDLMVNIEEATTHQLVVE